MFIHRLRPTAFPSRQWHSDLTDVFQATRFSLLPLLATQQFFLSRIEYVPQSYAVAPAAGLAMAAKPDYQLTVQEMWFPVRAIEALSLQVEAHEGNTEVRLHHEI